MKYTVYISNFENKHICMYVAFVSLESWLGSLAQHVDGEKYLFNGSSVLWLSCFRTLLISSAPSTPHMWENTAS